MLCLSCCHCFGTFWASASVSSPYWKYLAPFGFWWQCQMVHRCQWVNFSGSCLTGIAWLDLAFPLTQDSVGHLVHLLTRDGGRREWYALVVCSGLVWRGLASWSWSSLNRDSFGRLGSESGGDGGRPEWYDLGWLRWAWFGLVWFGFLTRPHWPETPLGISARDGGRPEWYTPVVWFDLVGPSHWPETPLGTMPYGPPAAPRRPKEPRVTGRRRWWEARVVRIGGTQAPALCLNQLLLVTQPGVATHHRRRLTHLWERTERVVESGEEARRTHPCSGPDPILTPDWILTLKKEPRSGSDPHSGRDPCSGSDTCSGKKVCSESNPNFRSSLSCQLSSSLTPFLLAENLLRKSVVKMQRLCTWNYPCNQCKYFGSSELFPFCWMPRKTLWKFLLAPAPHTTAKYSWQGNHLHNQHHRHLLEHHWHRHRHHNNQFNNHHHRHYHCHSLNSCHYSSSTLKSKDICITNKAG